MGAIYRLMGDATAARYGLLDGVITQPADTTAPVWSGSTITESAVTATGCTVTWPAATDAGAVSYRWRVSGGTWTPTTATSANISGQTAGATITVEVQAFDNAATPNYSLTTLSKQIALLQSGVGGGDVSALEARVALLEARLDAMLTAGLVRYDSGKLRVYS